MVAGNKIIALFAAQLVLGASGAIAAETLKVVDLAAGVRGDKKQFRDIRDFCGTKPMKNALSDGFTGNSWRKTVLAEFADEAKKCPNISEVRRTDGQGDPQRQIQDVKSLAAQGFNVIVVWPDFGATLLRAMHEATQAGVAVVPYGTGEDFPGVVGRDYAVTVTDNAKDKAKIKAEWVAKQLNGRGNVVAIGGLPGNANSAAQMEGYREVFARFPEIKLLETPDGNWDATVNQRVMAGMLAKYDKIDAVLTDYGLSAMGAVRAFVAANRDIPVWVTEDANEIGCFWQDNKAKYPNFKLATQGGRTWMVRLALRKAVAAYQGLDEPEPTVIEIPIEEDSTSPNQALWPKCDRSLPPDAMLSADLTREQMIELFK